jgi:hypothetical protein
MSDTYVFNISWEEIVNWYLAQPIYGQILILVGLIALLALAVVITYYILKGTVYLIYYVLKGVYYLLKGIGLLFYKIFEGLYYLISGKPKPQKNSTPKQSDQPDQPEKVQVEDQSEPNIPIQRTFQKVNNDVAFCSECGNEFSESMIHTLSDKGFAYCIHCGQGFKTNSMKIET